MSSRLPMRWVSILVRGRMVRTYKICVVSFIIAIFCASCFGPVHTDIDALIEPYSKKTDDFEYIRNCKKPKEFKGINKFRVSCFSSLRDEAWEDSFATSHSGLFSLLGSRGWQNVGTTNAPGYEISKNNPNLAIHVLERVAGKDDCNRRIYIDARELFENEKSGTTIGTQIYIADPRALYCGEARVLNYDTTN